jgi:hypothetical protein
MVTSKSLKVRTAVIGADDVQNGIQVTVRTRVLPLNTVKGFSGGCYPFLINRFKHSLDICGFQYVFG